MNDIKIIHPIIKYNKNEIILYFSKFIELSNTPNNAHAQMIPNNVQPTLPPIKESLNKFKRENNEKNMTKERELFYCKKPKKVVDKGIHGC